MDLREVGCDAGKWIDRAQDNVIFKGGRFRETRFE